MNNLSQIETVLKFLQCPECRQGQLTDEPSATALRCEQCGQRYPIQKGIPDLLSEQDRPLAKKAFGKLSAKSYDVFGARNAFRKLYRWRFEDEFDEYTCAVEVQPFDIVVDVGCGSGNYTLQFAKKVSKGVAIGIDLSMAMLELLVEHAQNMGLKNVVVIRANAENLPFKAGSLGKMFNGCLHHLFPNIKPGLDETHRCLGQDGILFGSTFFASQSALFKMAQEMSAWMLSARAVVPSILEQESQKAGFRQITIHPGGVGQFFFW
ncbi:MAG: methyltransferase domain-containing protein [Chloroflexota bacterium]